MLPKTKELKMKKQIMTLATLLILSAPVLANSLPQGVWSVTERTCTDGSEANDAFTFGRDSIEMLVSGGRMQVTSVINGQVQRSSGPILIKGRMVLGDDGRGQAFVLSKKNELILISAGFGDGGSCPKGEALLSVFTRK